jgi:hypothetical protein
MQYRGISGILSPKVLRLARNDRITLILRTLDGEQIEFSPTEGEAEYLKWRGTVNGKEATLLISVCTNCSSIQISK